ncbi:hypothetical protein C7S16_6802 [Burkholderia thailandensis]|uniref:Uncharacterized protein n=1 Tax=Burkholderia thailandensis TaxID=57975 RepID=A0AAW9CR89_BURTH|nr:hypothetical protein [Burkholderia thailandensis]
MRIARFQWEVALEKRLARNRAVPPESVREGPPPHAVKAFRGRRVAVDM